MFRSVSTLSQKAGVPAKHLRRLVLKELVDNALDAGANATVERDEHMYVVTDDGPGIAGSPSDIAVLFSLRRPMLSTKLLRMPTRGALGNGLRVVTGAVAASCGTLVVTTRGVRHELTPLDDGSTGIVSTADETVTVGTRVEICLGDLPLDEEATAWADAAILMSQGDRYTGKSSPFWYDGDAFYELLQAGGFRPVRDLIANLDGCSGAKAGVIASAFLGTPCKALSRDEAIALLGAARSHAKRVQEKRLGYVGKQADLPASYSSETGVVLLGGRAPKAEVPFLVEVWAEPCKAEETSVELLVNRTPVTGEVTAYRRGSEIHVHGAGLHHRIEKVAAGGFSITLNITTPHCPITTDGKEPDLEPFVNTIAKAILTVTRKAKATAPRERRKRTQKDVVLQHLAAAIAKASGDGQYRFATRQVLYVLRPIVKQELDEELKEANLQTILTAYENEHGEIRGMYRDPRGTLYHPHDRRNIAVGTLAVEEYERPAWTFNKILFVEKEGFFEALKTAEWPERNDCALLTSKGYSTRAVRDLLDLFADSDEPITIFAAHDADAFGSMIMQTLQEETQARPRRRVEIINLGLDPWEAIGMGLEVENREDDAKEAPVADYIKERSDGAYWQAWLQKHRVELNAMTMPQFISWLDRKMAEYGASRVLPPVEVVRTRMEAEVEGELRLRITEDILHAANIDGLVLKALSRIPMPANDDLIAGIEDHQADTPEDSWSDWVDLAALKLAAYSAA